MPRLSPLPQLALLACATAFSLGCKTIYSDVYAVRPNHFVPPAEKKIELPTDKKPAAPAVVVPAAGAGAGALPGIPGLMPADPAGLPAPAGGAMAPLPAP